MIRVTTKFAAIMSTLCIMLAAVIAFAGHRPVSCKGYMFWNIFEPHGGGHRWRKVEKPVLLRVEPISAGVWDLGEARSRTVLVMHAKTELQAHGLKTMVRDTDAVCWHYGDVEPKRPLWPVQP